MALWLKPTQIPLYPLYSQGEFSFQDSNPEGEGEICGRSEAWNYVANFSVTTLDYSCRNHVVCSGDCRGD